jgi:hypothetical protein
VARLLAIGVGFVGVLLIVRPGRRVHLHSVYALASVAFVTCATLTTRGMSAEVPSMTVALHRRWVTVFRGLAHAGPSMTGPCPRRWAGRCSSALPRSHDRGYLLSVMAVRVGELGLSRLSATRLLWALVLGLFVCSATGPTFAHRCWGPR